MRTVDVDLGSRSYPIHIGSRLLERPELYAPHLDGQQVMVVSNVTVAPLYAARVRAALGNRQIETVLLPDGEEHKTMGSLERILDALVGNRYARDCAIVALGGGVVGDIGGFAAACYHRGVRYVQAPTTLLAQVDSSVGGKTAVNHPLGKNLVGAFHQPVCVLADLDTLDTLPDRELRAGLAEVIKYGIVADLPFFDWLEEHVGAILAREPEALAGAVERSCRLKSEIVGDDEREAGRRALLNLGHTFGHAIEAGLGFGRWLHGEAVAAGMVLAADLSCRLGMLAPADRDRAEALLARAGLPTRAPGELSPERMLELMALDKKVQQGRMRLVLLEGLGRGVVTDAFDPAALRATLDDGRTAA